MTKCFCVDAGDHLVMGEDYSNPLEGERVGVPLRGGERASRHSETLGRLQVAQVLRVPFDMVAGVPTSVFDIHVEHLSVVLNC